MLNFKAIKSIDDPNNPTSFIRTLSHISRRGTKDQRTCPRAIYPLRKRDVASNKLRGRSNTRESWDRWIITAGERIQRCWSDEQVHGCWARIRRIPSRWGGRGSWLEFTTDRLRRAGVCPDPRWFYKGDRRDGRYCRTSSLCRLGGPSCIHDQPGRFHSHWLIRYATSIALKNPGLLGKSCA